MAAKEEQEPEEMSLFELASAKLSEAQKLMTEARELLRQDLDIARQEKSVIEEITKTLHQVHFSSTVVLNVGGKIYKTSLNTLRKDPDSMLCVMFSGRFELKPDEVDGAYFIDRDGKLFRYILNYLRDGVLRCPDDKNVRKELLAEAEFYQLHGIVSQLELKSPLIGSSIIEDEDHHSVLTSWLPPSSSCSLLYRASTDGNTPADFHRCCDNKGPTIVVIQSGEYICGGYTSRSWESANSFKAIADSQSFLFTLVNPSGKEPVKIAPKSGAGIRCRSTSGPSFGNREYYDLQVWASGSNVSTQGYVDLGYSYTRPDKVDKNKYFMGKTGFDISEMEVFKIIL